MAAAFSRIAAGASSTPHQFSLLSLDSSVSPVKFAGSLVVVLFPTMEIDRELGGKGEKLPPIALSFVPNWPNIVANVLYDGL